MSARKGLIRNIDEKANARTLELISAIFLCAAPTERAEAAPDEVSGH